MLDTAERAVNARRQFVQFLRRHAPKTTEFFDAELVFGELLSNITRRQPGPASILVDVVGDEAIVVIDGPSPEEEADEPGSPEDLSENGRGLHLIRTLSRDYYVDRGPRGERTILVLGLRRFQHLA